MTVLSSIIFFCAPAVLSQTVVADSVAGFSATQGAGGWAYGFLDDIGAFHFLPVFVSDVWGLDSDFGNPPWVALWSWGGHPDAVISGGSFRAADRRWVSDVAGTVTISGTAAKHEFFGNGDGTTVHVVVDGVDMWSYFVSPFDSVGTTYSIDAEVHVGSEIDFVINPNDSDTSDQTILAGTITLQSPWTSLGFGLAGAAGIPTMVGSGSLTPLSQGSLAIGNAAPTAVLALFVGFTNSPTGFKGGVLVPVPVALTLMLATDAFGTANLPFTWPPAAPSGTTFYAQCAIKDASAPQGVSLTNALKAISP